MEQMNGQGVTPKQKKKYMLMIERLKSTMDRMHTQEQAAAPRPTPVTPQTEPAAKVHRVGYYGNVWVSSSSSAASAQSPTAKAVAPSGGSPKVAGGGGGILPAFILRTHNVVPVDSPQSPGNARGAEGEEDEEGERVNEEHEDQENADDDAAAEASATLLLPADDDEAVYSSGDENDSGEG
ncbi:hypothetical protein FOZ62_003295 [Perkinsus olseni]|uniref:Uncharacterized protein n=1 Tax=Perkinsus olseni TaxID=32597 RepID=A0A7J6QQ58_PEROL|nr:hypothetical protein FOZ62_003295 [Perkinsus olseni]